MTPITFPDRIRVCEELLYGLDRRPIDIDIANIIYGHFQNKSTYFVEYEVWDDPRLENPTKILLERPNLWRFDQYIADSNNWKSVRNYSEQRRVDNEVLRLNIKMVTYHLCHAHPFDEERAQMLATMLVRKNLWGNIRALGVNKRLTKEDL